MAPFVRGRGGWRALLALVLLAGPVWAHNLDQIDTSINYDDDFIKLMLAREDREEELIQDGDEFWMIFRSTPGPGTATGAGGYLTFYIPTNYVEVLEASYLTPSPGTPGTLEAPTNFTRVPLKGASIIAVGSGTIAPASTPALAGLTLTNAFGQAEAPVTATGLHRGTIAGVYADTGIFFSQDPRTLYHSWMFAPEEGPLSRRGYPITMVNNRGELITPITRYDAEQLIAYGRKDVAPVVDPNGRGNAPWGLANVVAGPLCGYAWQFDLNTWVDTTNMQAACSSVGPWQRIRYPGSQYALDQAGLISAQLGYAGQDASSLGYALGVDPGESQLPGDANAIRVSYGMLELGRPEYAAVRIRVKNPPSAECFTITTDAFGGDAGGLDDGKDHEWRYYDPTLVTLNPCTYLAKVPSDPVVRPGDTLYFDITFINNGMAVYTNVVLTDTLPSGLTFLSAVPPQNTGPNPLVWNLGPVGINEMRQFRVYVRTTGVGTFFNRVVATSHSNILAEALGVVEVSYRSLLRGDKTVTPESVAPGGMVTYTLTVYNDGAGPNGVPLVINELLPPGFSYLGMVDQQINGHHLPDPFLVINSANPNRPTFTIRDGIYAGQTLVMTFNAAVAADQPAGTYCNSYYLAFEDKVISVPPQACVTIGGAQIGDMVYRDWDGDGTQDAGEEGLPGVTVNLYEGSCPATGTLYRSTTSGTNGTYAFTGLDSGSYCVEVATNTAPAGYTLTTANPLEITLLENEINLDADFGFLPGGGAAITARVFDDQNGDGGLNGADAGIAGITVRLYEDSNGNGALDSGDLLLETASTDGAGAYAFTNLAAGLSYLVAVDHVDADLAAYFSPNPFTATTPALRAVPNLTGTDTTADFGYLATLPSSIGDMVFVDVNFNGTYDPADLPLPDITVALYRSGGGLEPLETRVSDLTGRYLFTNLAPDTYLVEVDANDIDVPGGLGIVVGQHLVSLAASSSHLDADFAFQRFIGKSVDKAYAVTNELLTYTIGVGYPGDEPLEDARVIDPFPAGVTFSNATAGGVYGPYVPLPAVPGVEQAAVVELAITNPVADTYVRQDSPALNYDAGQRVKVKFEANKEHVGLMRFDLSEIPEDSIIHDAWFSYNVQNIGNFNTMNAFRLLTDWTETGATWNDSGVAGGDWASAGGSFGTSDYAATAYGPMSVNPVGWKSNDVTGLVKEWIEGGQPNYGVALVAAAVNADLAEIYDREDVATGVAPRLDIGYEEAGNITTTNSLKVSRTVMATGETVTVTMTLWASHAISNVTPVLEVNSAAAAISGPAETVPATVPAKTPTTFTYVCTPARVDELVFTGLAESEDGYAFVESRSASVLVSANGSSNVVSWALGTNTAAQGGAAASGGTMPGLYAFQGKTKAFWNYSTMSNLWTAKASVTDVEDQGAGLAYDGNNTIYGLRGAGTKRFWSYSLSDNKWTIKKDAPQNVKWGGALVYLNGYVYAFRGDDKADFWRYDPVANTWAIMASAPAGVKEGGALTTDGTAIYAVRGKDTALFWKYDVAANSWGTLANAPGNIKKGGALTHLNGYVYAFKGGDKKDFFRYSIAGNTWSKLAGLPVNVNGGGSLASDGAYVWALSGDAVKSFFRYNPTAGTWTKMKDAPGNVGDGGALVYAKGTAASLRQVSLGASRSLVSSGSVVTVTMEVLASATQANVRPSGLTVTAVNGATATLVAGPSPTTLPTLNSNEVGQFTWTYLVKSGTGIGSVTFSGSATNGAGQTFGTAISGNVIVVPPLVFRATVNNPIEVPRVENTAILRDVSGAIPPTLSETVYTALAASIGDRIWNDADGDGVQEAGEPGIPGVTVWLHLDLDNDGEIDPEDLRVAETTTDLAGLYHFFGVLPGTNYTVTYDNSTVPAGFLPTTASNTNSPSLTVHDVGTISVAQQYAVADFGLRSFVYVPFAAVGDQVFIDANANGICDAGDAPLPNVTVSLYLDLNGDDVGQPGELVATTVTDAPGGYLFENLGAGTYIVVVDTADPDLPTGLVPTVTQHADVSLSAGEERRDIDFPFTKLPAALDKEVSPTGNVEGDDVLTYTVAPAYTNNLALTNVVVSDPLPAGTTYVPGSANAGGATNASGAVVWNLGTTTPGTSSSVAGLAATTVVLYATADTWLKESTPDTTGGGASPLKVNCVASKYATALLRFDLSSIPVGAVISNATMTLLVTTAQGNHVDDVRSMLTDWDESTATWNTNGIAGSDWSTGAFSSSDYSGTSLGAITPSTTGQKTLGITGQVRDWVNYGVTNYGLMLLPTGTSDKDVQYASREFGTPTNRPHLSVTYTIPSRTNSISVSRSLVVSNTQVTVTMNLSASSCVSNVVPTLAATGSNGATATLVSGPSPGSTAICNSGSFTWVYTLHSGTSPGSVVFSGSASNAVGITWSNATSASVLVTPPLTFQATVDGTTGAITNRAWLSASNLPATPSPEVVNYLGATIGDYVWQDDDGDGLQDTNEFGIAGVKVYIDANTNGTWEAGEPEATTDLYGLYHISGLTAGTYSVRYDPDTIPLGYSPSTPVPLSVPLTTLQAYTEADFGLVPLPPGPPSIGDTVWLDYDADGVVEAGEPGLSNVIVTLYYDANGNREVDASDFLLGSATTDTNGFYRIGTLLAGSYLVDVDTNSLPPGLSLVSGTTPHAVTVISGQNYGGADFGYNWCGQIGDLVWWDDDRDGIPDAGEPPVAGAYVMLYLDVNSNGVLDLLGGDYMIKGMPSRSDGSYLFTNLPPGMYHVDVYEDSIGLDGPVPTTPYVRSLTLGPCEARLDVDFGYFIGARIEGNVFGDANRNLLFDPDENGLANVTVFLNGIDVNGYVVAMSNVTDAAGHYVFVAPEGEYTTSYDMASLLASYPLLREPTTATHYAFHAYAGDEWHPSFDFGVDHAGRVGDTVYGDMDRDGMQDFGEPGLRNVLVILYDATTNALEFAQTDLAGRYEFIGLDDGTYWVQVYTNTLPAGYLTVPTADPTPPLDGWGQAAVLDGAVVSTMDFGYPPVPERVFFSVAGRVYYDANSNGLFGAGEAGISNVTLTVAVDTNADAVADFFYAAPTDTDGVFGFAGIPSNSTVTITVDEATLPDAAYHLTGDPNGAPLTNVWTIAGIAANAGNLDFGYVATYGSVSGTSCIGDGNGLYDPDMHDVPLADVLITLRYSGRDGILGTDDDVVREYTTGADGAYHFEGLPPGYYSITESAVASYAYLDLADADGGDPNVIYATFALGEEKTRQDFENTHWLGTAGVVYNAAVSSSNEYIWTDKPEEQRIENTNAINDDIREVRMFANDSNFYIRVTMHDIQDDDLPYVAIGLDTRRSTNSMALDWLGDDAGLGLGGDYFDPPGATHYPVRNIIVHKVAGEARAELFTSDGYHWYPPPSGWSAAIISTYNDGLELRIPRTDLTLDGSVTGRFTIASFLNTGLWANEGDSTLEAYPGTADAADSMSIAPWQVNDGQLDVNAWREDISDYDIDFWVDVAFDEAGIVDNARPSTPAVVAPTNGAEVSARPTLSWEAATDSDGDVTGYFLEVSTNSTFNGVDGTENGLIALRVNLPATQTNYVLSTSLTQYWWRVRARDTAGMLSDATVQEFHIGGKADVEGPVPTLMYVGTNLTGFLAGEFDEFIARYGYIDSLTDGEMAGGSPLSFAIRWDDPSGVFATNWMSAEAATPGAFTWNIAPESGRVSPNWDVVETNTQTGSSLQPVTNQWFWGTNVSAVGNAALSLTNWAFNAFAITAFNEDVATYLALSAEDDCTQNGYAWDAWDSQGAASPPDWGGYAADAPNSSRNITTNYPLPITMRDDDVLPPVAAMGQGWDSSRSLLASNSTSVLDATGAGQAALYNVYDGDLVADSLTLMFNAYDFYSGIQVSSVGPGTTNTTLSIGFGPRLTGNYTHFSAARSSVADMTADTTVLAWHWNSFSPDDVTELWGGDGSGIAGATNPVRLTMWDNDADRPDDQAIAPNVIFGYLQVQDDDTVPPAIALADVKGLGAQNFYTDSGEVLFYDFGTGDPATLQPSRSFPSLGAADVSVTGTVPTTATTGNPSGSAVYAANWTDGAASYWEWTVTVDPGFELNLQKLAFASRSTSTGPATWALKNSADGFTETLASGALNNNGVFETIAATGLAASVNSGTTTYRLYGAGASSAAGTWRLDNVSFTGKVSSISGAFLVTDSDLNTNGLAIVASVQDPGSGIYNVNHADYRPTYDLVSPLGVASIGHDFGAGPAADGAGRLTAATLAATNGLDYADIVLGVYTASVTATDYDVDRVNDRLAGAGESAFMVIDDDTAGPKFSSLRGTYLTFDGVSAGSEANAVTDGMLTNGLTLSNRVYDIKSGVLGDSLQFRVRDPAGWNGGWQDFPVQPEDGGARTNRFLSENTVWVENFNLDLDQRALGVWTTEFYGVDFDNDRPDDAMATLQSFQMFVVDDDTVGPQMTNFTSMGAAGALIATGFEVVDGWGLHDNGNWSEEANDGTWTATSVYIETFWGRGGQGYYPGFNAVDDALQLPPVDRPGWLILWARLSAAGESKMALEQWNGATWDSLGERAVTTTNYAEHSWTIDSWQTNVVLRLRMAEKTDGNRSIYFDDLVVAPNRPWTNAGVPLAWEEADDLATGDSGIDQYRMVPLGGAVPLDMTNGVALGLAQSAVAETSATAQGVVTGYVFAVDADKDRGLPDRSMGYVLPHVQRIDITPPTVVNMGPGGTNAVTETADDPTTQFDLTWSADNVGPDDPGHANHPTGLPGDQNLLSPWRSYKIYYGTYNPTFVPTNDNPYSETTGYIFTNFLATGFYTNWPSVTADSPIEDPSAAGGIQPDYQALTNPAQNHIRLYDLEFDEDYVVVVVGVDHAGNEGPAGPFSWATNNTIRFALIKGATRQKCDLLAEFPDALTLTNTTCHAASALYWIAAGETNVQGIYTEVRRDYDLICWDSGRFRESSSNKWRSLGSVHTNWYVDDGGHHRPRGQIRFYRASYKDRWKTTNLLGQVQRPTASEEVYAMHNVVLSPGQNFVSLHGVPTLNTFEGVFGGTDRFPGGESMLPAAGATIVEFYSSGTNAMTTANYWLKNTGQWFDHLGNDVTTVLQPASFFTRGFSITLPENLPTNYVETTALDHNQLDPEGNPIQVPAFYWEPIAQVPTNGFSQTIATGTQTGRVGTVVYNVVALRLPVSAHPAEMRLRECGFVKGPRGLGDEIYTMNTATKAVLSDSTIYCDADGVWRFFISNNTVPAGFFKPNDVIVIVSRNGGVGNHWTWTYHPTNFYTLPTRWMGY